MAVPIAGPRHATLEDGEGQPLLGGQPEDFGNSFARKGTVRLAAAQGLLSLGVSGYRPLAIAAVRMAADNQTAIPLPADVLQLLAAEEIAEHAAAPQVPDDDEAPAVANEDLAGVPRMFLQSLHHLKHAPLAGLLWQPLQYGVRADGLVLQSAEGWHLYHKHGATLGAQVKQLTGGMW